METRMKPNKPFIDFVEQAEVITVPNQFFTKIMPRIDDIAELKTVLHILWLLSYQKDYPCLITWKDLLSDPVLARGIAKEDWRAEETLARAMASAVEHGILLRLEIQKGGNFENAYLLNGEAERSLVDKIQRGEAQLPNIIIREVEGGQNLLQPNIFALYEQNIGMLTPMIVEELKEAEKYYPSDWIEGAFKEAVRMNKRSWKYIARILERWNIEGKDDGKLERHFKTENVPDKYVRGKYGHMVRR